MKTLMFTCFFLSSILMMLFSLMVEKNIFFKKNKKKPFECGFEVMSEKKTTFSTNFIMLMMMFLIFDVEISILMPFTLMSKNNQSNILMASTALIVLLTCMMTKEWKQGSLEWMK